jgi:hypothetical protein
MPIWAAKPSAVPSSLSVNEPLPGRPSSWTTPKISLRNVIGTHSTDRNPIISSESEPDALPSLPASRITRPSRRASACFMSARL